MKLGTSYFGNRILRHAARDMNSLARQGFNLVIHTFSENDFKFYKTTMREIVAATHDAGHEVYVDPWGVGQVFGGEAFSIWAQMHAADGCQMASDGKPVGCACPNSPAFREFMKEWIEAAASTGADVAFWDEPHFYLSTWMVGRPNTWGCLCKYCKAAYEEKHGEAMPTTETEQVAAFKTACLLDFVKFLVKAAHKAGMRNALCVLPYDEPGAARKKWLPFAKIQHLDVFGTDPYWCVPNSKKTVEMVRDFSVLTREVCDKTGREGQIWIQGFMIPEGREWEVGRAVDMAVEAGIRNIAVWGFDACEHLSHIRCGNGPKVWRALTGAYHRARQNAK